MPGVPNAQGHRSNERLAATSTASPTMRSPTRDLLLFSDEIEMVSRQERGHHRSRRTGDTGFVGGVGEWER